MTRHEELRGEGFSFTGFTLLCHALAYMAKLKASGFTCMLVPETMCKQEFTVHFVAHKRG